MAITPDMIRRVTSSAKAGISREDAERVLEIACLAVVSDGTVAPEEQSVLRIAAGELGASAPIVDTLLNKVTALGARDAQVDRLREVADALGGDVARQLAYKITVLTAMVDLAAADAEFEFDIDVQDALQLASEDAERLTGEVQEAVTVDG